jgi:hypothetical protein
MQIELGEYLSQERCYIVKTQGSLQVLINPLPPRAKGPSFLLSEDKYSFAIYLYASKDKELLIKGKRYQMTIT